MLRDREVCMSVGEVLLSVGQTITAVGQLGSGALSGVALPQQAQ
ncbi:hypothetical protein ABE021_04615 [Sporosarcina gallistercoris]